MTPSLLQQGLLLMLTGMGTVFVFLSVLVVAMNLMSRALARLPAPLPPAGGRTDNDAGTIAAIAAALHRHRRKNGES